MIVWKSRAESSRTAGGSVAGGRAESTAPRCRGGPSRRGASRCTGGRHRCTSRPCGPSRDRERLAHLARSALQTFALAIHVHVISAHADAEVVALLRRAALHFHHDVGARRPSRLGSVLEFSDLELLRRPLGHHVLLRTVAPLGLGASPRAFGTGRVLGLFMVVIGAAEGAGGSLARLSRRRRELSFVAAVHRADFGMLSHAQDVHGELG